MKYINIASHKLEMRKEAAQEWRIIMIDVAQNLMSLGESIAAAHTASVNDNMTRSHYHDYYELYFLDNGERYHYIDDKLYKTEAGDCIIFPPQTMHRSYSEQGCTFSRIVLYFRPDIISSDALRQKLADSYCIYKSDTESLKKLRRLMYYFLEAQNSASAYKQEQMEALVNLIIITVLGMKESTIGIERHNRTTHIINYINNNYEHDISLDVLADMFHISTYYLCREFKKNTNRTVVDYIKRTRIMNAERLFKETDKNVTEVATLTGFSNLTHFNRVFKEIAGVNPSQYKKLHTKN